MNPINKEIWLVAQNMGLPEFEDYLEKKYTIRLRDNKEVYQPKQTEKTGTCTSIPAESFEMGNSETAVETDRYERMRIEERFLDDD